MANAWPDNADLIKIDLTVPRNIGVVPKYLIKYHYIMSQEVKKQPGSIKIKNTNYVCVIGANISYEDISKQMLLKPVTSFNNSSVIKS